MKKKLFSALIALMAIGLATPAFAQTTTSEPTQPQATTQVAASPTKERKIKDLKAHKGKKFDKKMRRIQKCDSLCAADTAKCLKANNFRKGRKGDCHRRRPCQGDTAVCPPQNCRPCAPQACQSQQGDSTCTCNPQAKYCRGQKDYAHKGKHHRHHHGKDLRRSRPAVSADSLNLAK